MIVIPFYKQTTLHMLWGLCFNPWCKWSMWDAQAQHVTMGSCIWLVLTLLGRWHCDTVTLTPALITLWRQTDRDRLISWGRSAKLGHAKWRSGGLFLFNFNLENPTKVLPLFDEQTTLQFGDLQTFLKGFLLNINKAREIESIYLI